MDISKKELLCILNVLEEEYEKIGYEFYPFKVAWYNKHVSKAFHFELNDDTLAILAISNPHMFEKAFLPFLKDKYVENQNVTSNDPIDECSVFHLSKIKQLLPHSEVEVIYDFDLHPNRRPKVLMQTAAHVSGAAYFYQKSSLETQAFGNKKVYGVCIHPEYGGWFALRAVILVKNLQCPHLIQKPCKDVLQSEESKIQLLELYNFHWQDWTFRDVIPVTQKYSPLAIKYFSTLPKDRHLLLKEFVDSYKN